MEHNINCQFILKKKINILSLLIYNKSKRNKKGVKKSNSILIVI
jgi:hypothetical protein